MTTLFESMTSTGTSNSSTTPSLDLLEESLDVNNPNKGNLTDDDKADTNGSLVSQKGTTAVGDNGDQAQDNNDGLQRQNEAQVNQGITVRADDGYSNGDGESALQYQYTAVTGQGANPGAVPVSFGVADPNNQMSSMRVVHVNVEQNQAVNTTAVHNINNASASVAYTLGAGNAAGNNVNVFHGSEANAGVQQVNAVTVDGQGDGSRYTYYPAVQTSEGNSQPGPFYVMVSPQDMIPVSGASVTPPRIIAPRAHAIQGIPDGTTFALENTEQAIPVDFRKVETGRSSRDERRRATHNEVERRRRDKINTWITKLATVVPECQIESAKQGQVKRQDDTIKSKGGILSKTVDYILKLRQTNERLTEAMKDHENTIAENCVLRQQVEDLRRQNTLLHANLQIHQEQVNDTKMET